MPRSQIIGSGVFDGSQSKRCISKLVGGFASKRSRVVTERRADNLLDCVRQANSSATLVLAAASIAGRLTRSSIPGGKQQRLFEELNYERCFPRCRECLSCCYVRCLGLMRPVNVSKKRFVCALRPCSSTNVVG